jgi:hypothetical protein
MFGGHQTFFVASGFEEQFLVASKYFFLPMESERNT